MIFPRPSLKRSPRTQTRKSATSVDMNAVYSSSHSSMLAHRKSRPPPLQIIPELSEHVLDISAAHSPATARPRQPELESSRVTLSAYTFSIDDALLMFAGDAPRSPALSASSTSDGASSEDVPATPRSSDNEEEYDLVLHTPRFRPQRVSIRPLCITKTRHFPCQDDEDIHNYFEQNVFTLPLASDASEDSTTAKTVTQAMEEAGEDFYAREFEDFVTLLSATPSPTFPARRDSLILVEEALPIVVEVLEPKPRGRSRHSKPLPLLPPVTPPASSFPPTSILPLVQTSAQKSAVRKKRNMRPTPSCPLPPTPMSRPLPRMLVPLDIEDCAFPAESLSDPFNGPIVSELFYDHASIYSQPSFAYTDSTSIHLLPPAVAETPLSKMYGETILPRTSMDSDASRSSIDSIPSSASSTSPSAPFPPFLPPSSPSEERLRSRWSSSTLDSLAAEPPRGVALFSPLRGVFSSRTRWVPSPPQKIFSNPTPPKAPKSKRGSPATSSPPNTSSRHMRQGSRSSTSSTGTSLSGCDSRDGSPSGLKRKPIPIAMFLRAS